MPVGTSSGENFPDEISYQLAQSGMDRPSADNANVHVIRHGSTDYNSDEKVRSWSNVPLNEDGIRESKEVAEEMKAHPVDVLFHSDLDRAADTAKEVAKTTGAEQVPMKEFRSWNAGELTGKPYSEATPVMQDYAYNKPDEKLPGGESFNEFRDRVLDGLARAELYANGRQSGIVTHRGVERLFNSMKEGSEDQPHLPTFFDDGEDTGSHQIMSLFGTKTGKEQFFNYMEGMLNKVIKIDPDAWDKAMESFPESKNIEDRRTEHLTDTATDKLRYLMWLVNHENITEDLKR